MSTVEINSVATLVADYSEHFRRAVTGSDEVADDDLRDLNQRVIDAGLSSRQRLEIIGQALAATLGTGRAELEIINEGGTDE